MKEGEGTGAARTPISQAVHAHLQDDAVGPDERLVWDVLNPVLRARPAVCPGPPGHTVRAPQGPGEATTRNRSTAGSAKAAHAPQERADRGWRRP